MPGAGILWIVFTLLAAAAQTARNAMQRELTGKLDTAGATHVRFLFGCPFAVLFLIGATAATGVSPPYPPPVFWPWILLGALAQIVATALMLSAMRQRSFLVAIAYIKTEPVQVAAFGLVALGDPLTAPLLAAILIATFGVILASRTDGTGGARPVALGLAAGAMFALSAVGYRGAILSLAQPSFLMAASFTLAAGLLLQAALLTLYLAARSPSVLAAIAAAWRPSLFAGFMGAVASQFWFLAFALATAASVRTLALVEVLFAHAVTRFVFKQKVSGRETAGIVLIVIGVTWLILAQ